MKFAKFTAGAVAAALAVSAMAVSSLALELDKIDGAAVFTYEAEGKAWAHIWNAYNTASLYDVPSGFAEGSKDLIVKFKVSGMTEGECYSVFPGYQSYGDAAMDDDGEELSIWNQDDYSVTGSTYDYYINGDGEYELIVPIKTVADAHEKHWGESIYSVGILELCFNGVANEEMTGPANEDLVIEFLGVEESSDAHTVAECAFGTAPTDEPSDTQSEPSEEDDTVSEPAADDDTAQTEKPNTQTGAEGIAAAAAVAVAASGAAVIARKKK